MYAHSYYSRYILINAGDFVRSDYVVREHVRNRFHKSALLHILDNIFRFDNISG